MKVLFIASHKEHLPSHMAPFIKEQAEALKKQGVDVACFTIQGKGIKGYLGQLKPLKQKIKAFQPDVIHAHYGMSGLLANLQRRVSVVTTYHGSDINEPKARTFSKLAIWLSAHNVFVSQRLIEIAQPKKKYSLLPCGVNVEELQFIEKADARVKMGLQADKKYVLFAGSFDNNVKNALLAKDAIALLPDVELLELRGYSRQEVTILLYAVDAFLMTSFTEGSPQVIKEAMACGCPIVSVDVGDVASVIHRTAGCYLAERHSQELAEKLKQAMQHSRTNGKNRIIELGLENETIARQLIQIYDNVRKNK